METKEELPRREGTIGFFARSPIVANLSMLLLIVGGFYTMYTIQKEVLPEFELDIVNVSVVYPGASPSEVEEGIVLPVEESIRGVQGIKEITSTSREGSGSVAVELVAGADRMKAFQDIDQAVNRIQSFPTDIERPQVSLQAIQRDVMEIGLYGEVDIWTLRLFAERLKNILLSNKEITQVEINNVPEFVTHVEIPSQTLLKYNITLGQVADVIRQSSFDIPAGAIETESGEISLRMQERKSWADQFEEIDVISSATGATVKLGDIATVVDGFEEEGFHGQFNQQNSVSVEIFRIGNQSPLEIESVVKDIVTEFEGNLPPGVNVRISGNRADDYRERLSLLTENGLMAIVIVMVILTLFLEYRLAFWVMIGMSVSFIGGIMFLPLVGISVNMISMFGFLVVLGIVVDDAIVVGENIYEYRNKGMNFLDAAIAGTKDVSRPVIFSILTTIVAFTPLMFMPGTTGKYWWPLPAVVVVVLFVSLFEALLILPSHVAHKPKKNKLNAVKKLEQFQRYFGDGLQVFIQKLYQPLLKVSLANRYVTLTLAVATLVVVISYGLSGHMGLVLMPEDAADEIEAGVRLPVGTTSDQAAAIAEDITASTLRMFEENDLYKVAEGVKTNIRRKSFIDVEVVMRPPDQRDMSAREFIQLWRDNIGEIQGVSQITFEAERGPGGWQQDISVDLSHPEPEVLEKAAMSFLERVERFKETKDVNDNYDKGKLQYGFELLPEARSLGLTPEYVGRQIRDAFFGALAIRQLRGINETEVRVKLPEEERQDINQLQDFIIQTPNGTIIPLKDVVKLVEGTTFNSIGRRNGKRVINVGMDVEPDNAQTRVLASIENEVLPALRSDFPGITWTFEGSQAEMRESTGALWSGFAIAMLIIYSLLAVALNNYIQPVIVMFAIPFGIVGAVIGHIILGYSLSLVSLMGVIALSGVVVNDSLIMIDHANKHRGTGDAFSCILNAGARRFRPIVLTTLTTFAGLTPIILETSRQARQLIPMAISLGFGIVFATAIILIIVPCLYMIAEDIAGLLNQKTLSEESVPEEVGLSS